VENGRVTDPADLLGPDRDPRISEIFYFFEALTTLTSGRTVGRKIGVVQEVLLKKYLEADERLRRRMYLENLLEGESGASHKVEFSWYAIEALPGTEVGAEIPNTDGLKVLAVDEVNEKVRIDGPWDGNAVSVASGRSTAQVPRLSKHLRDREIDLRIRGLNGGAIEVDLVDRTALLASLESKRVGAQRFSSSDALGAGIQTIEKAKQASLVAIDLDLKHNKQVKPLGTATDEKKLLSFVALGNGVHWTAKDKAVLGTYVDYTFLVRDAGIIRYAEFVRERLADDEEFLEAFMAYFKGMTKQEDDDFAVVDYDFAIVVPEQEKRTLRQVLVDHIERVNP
jgi:hypothetical protein